MPITGRPKPNILISDTDPTTFIKLEITQGTGLYIVLYKGQPFSIRRSHIYLNRPFTYQSSTFTLPGHATAMVKRLNKLFQCDDFEMVTIKPNKLKPRV